MFWQRELFILSMGIYKCVIVVDKISNMDETFFIFCLWNIDVIFRYNWAFYIFLPDSIFKTSNNLRYTLWVDLSIYIITQYILNLLLNMRLYKWYDNLTCKIRMKINHSCITLSHIWNCRMEYLFFHKLFFMYTKIDSHRQGTLEFLSYRRV